MAVTVFGIFKDLDNFWTNLAPFLDLATLQLIPSSPAEERKVEGKVAADRHDPALKTFYPSLACLTFSYAVCVFERQSFEPCFTTLKSPLAMYCFYLGVIHK